MDLKWFRAPQRNVELPHGRRHQGLGRVHQVVDENGVLHVLKVLKIILNQIRQNKAKIMYGVAWQKKIFYKLLDRLPLVLVVDIRQEVNISLRCLKLILINFPSKNWLYVQHDKKNHLLLDGLHLVLVINVHGGVDDKQFHGGVDDEKQLEK